MNIDALFNALPDAPWIPFVAAALLLLLIADKIIASYTALSDRRSDNQLLEQAEKAASILEKLPDGHRARSDLLTYVSHGPVAELTERHTNRITRKKEARKRQRHRFNLGASVVILGVIFIPALPDYYRRFLSNIEPSSNSESALMLLLATMIFFFAYSGAVLLAFAAVTAFQNVGDLFSDALYRLLRSLARKRHERKGRGGFYQI